MIDYAAYMSTPWAKQVKINLNTVLCIGGALDGEFVGCVGNYFYAPGSQSSKTIEYTLQKYVDSQRNVLNIYLMKGVTLVEAESAINQGKYPSIFCVSPPSTDFGKLVKVTVDNI